MTAVPFDTLKFVESLEDGGFTPQQAKAAAHAFAAATGEELATRGDINVLRADFAKAQSSLEREIQSVKVELRAEIKAAAADVKIDILRWLVLTQVALGGLLLAAIRYLPASHP